MYKRKHIKPYLDCGNFEESICVFPSELQSYNAFNGQPTILNIGDISVLGKNSPTDRIV